MSKLSKTETMSASANNNISSIKLWLAACVFPTSMRRLRSTSTGSLGT